MSGLGGGGPHPGVTPPIRTGLGTPQIGTGWGYPALWGLDGDTSPPPNWTGWGTSHQDTEQQSEHLLCGRWYASCVHAELSCLF